MLHRLHARAGRAPLVAALALSLTAAASLFSRTTPTTNARAAAVFTVNSTADTQDANTNDGLCADANGNCTLRAALMQAGASPGPDTINFSIGTGPQTIIIFSILPGVTSTVIDGTTQPGFAGKPIIEVDGNLQGNARGGLLFIWNDTTVRGLVLNHANDFGVLIVGTNNRVEGNFIGTDIRGLESRRNLSGGVRVEMSGNVIGGTTAAARNVISGNGGDGIVCGSGNVIQGNYIGTDLTGTRAVPNFQRGILVNGANSRVGGTEPGARNLISGNSTLGVGLGDGSSANVIEGNFIGTDVTGTRPLPNGLPFTLNLAAAGVGVSGSGNRIGGIEPGAGNVIASNGTAGVGVASGLVAPVSNTVRGNSIFSNTGLGIELSPGLGVTPNDDLDADTGANRLQNFPHITAVTTDGATTTVRGFFNSTPSTTFTLDFYTNPACDPTGHGEGARYFGTAAVTTDAAPAGEAAFLVTLPAALPPGRVLTATATAPDGGTSEFGPCGGGAAGGVVRLGDFAPFVRRGMDFPVQLQRVGGSEGTLTVNFSTGTPALDFSTRPASFLFPATPSVDYTPVNQTVTFGPGETVKTVFVPIPADGTPDNNEGFAIRVNSPETPEVVDLLRAEANVKFITSEVSQLSVESASFREGDDGTTSAVVSIRILAPSADTVTADYATRGLSAAPGADYVHTTGSVTFPPGATRQTVTVPVVGDLRDEHDETFTLDLTNATIPVSSGSPQLTISDDDAAPLLAVGDASVVEPTSGTAALVFPVTLSAPSEKEIPVQLSTDNGTATANSDYVSTSPFFFFPPNTTTVNVTVTVNSDALDEPAENFFLNVFGTVFNAAVGDSRGVGTILRTDSPNLQFSLPAYTAGEGSHVFNVTVVRAGDASAAASVNYATLDGTASERRDYATVLGTLRFAPGETSQTFPVLLTEDAFGEGDETVRLSLRDAQGVALGPQSAAELVVTNDPPPAPGNPIDDARVFVRQHYHDFLNREPDQAGLDFWTNQITSCGPDPSCVEARRVAVSSAFFLSIEFQSTGYQVIRIYQSSFPNTAARPRALPRYREFLRDTREIGRGVVVGVGNWEQQLRDNTREFARRWVESPEFVARFPANMPADQFVAQLFATARVTPTADERNAALAAFGAGGTDGRAAALLSVTNSGGLYNRLYNPAFVLMQYIGYLRRSPDDQPDFNFVGYDFWLTKLNSFSQSGGDVRDEAVAINRVGQAEMIRAFISSAEYRRRFGQ